MTFRDNIVLLTKPFDTPSRCFVLFCLHMHLHHVYTYNYWSLNRTRQLL